MSEEPKKWARPRKQTKGLGTIIERLALPVARVIDGVLQTNIQECGACKKRRDKLDELFPLKKEE